MQINEQLRLHQLRGHDLKKLLIQLVFLFREIDTGKKKTLGKKIIRYRKTLKKIAGMTQFLELFIAFGHKEELQRKSILSGILVEFGKKGVIRELLEDQPGVVMSGQK